MKVTDEILDDMARALIPRLDGLLVQEAVELGIPAPSCVVAPSVPAPDPARFTHCPRCGSTILEVSA